MIPALQLRVKAVGWLLVGLMTQVSCNIVHFYLGMDSLYGLIYSCLFYLETIILTGAGDSKGPVEVQGSGWTDVQILPQAFQA